MIPRTYVMARTKGCHRMWDNCETGEEHHPGLNLSSQSASNVLRAPHSGESGGWLARGRFIMAAYVVGVDARGPLCGCSILSIGRGGHVTAEDLHPVPLHKRGGSGEGYMLCDDCGVLAELPSDITLN